ncbi:MAG: hypothetical protein Q8O92_06260 [Candidatus Latescibacter sp.]|nr:hypothetical protein [Candidatus Latescibacter sp.]
MKKILGIVGSPRKNGNTHILVSTILQSAHEALMKAFIDRFVFFNCLRSRMEGGNT